MADPYLKIPPDYFKYFSRSYVSRQYSALKPRSNLFSYASFVYSSFYSTLLITIVLTIVFLNQSHLADNLMAAIRLDQQTKTSIQENLSNINIFKESGLSIFVHLPSNDFVGESIDGVRFYNQNSKTYFSDSITANNPRAKKLSGYLHFTQPDNGLYLILINCAITKSYQLAIETSDYTGQAQHNYLLTVPCQSDTPKKLQLLYHQDPDQKNSLTEI